MFIHTNRVTESRGGDDDVAISESEETGSARSKFGSLSGDVEGGGGGPSSVINRGTMSSGSLSCVCVADGDRLGVINLFPVVVVVVVVVVQFDCF